MISRHVRRNDNHTYAKNLRMYASSTAITNLFILLSIAVNGIICFYPQTTWFMLYSAADSANPHLFQTFFGNSINATNSHKNPEILIYTKQLYDSQFSPSSDCQVGNGVEVRSQYVWVAKYFVPEGVDAVQYDLDISGNNPVLQSP